MFMTNYRPRWAERVGRQRADSTGATAARRNMRDAALQKAANSDIAQLTALRLYEGFSLCVHVVAPTRICRLSILVIWQYLRGAKSLDTKLQRRQPVSLRMRLRSRVSRPPSKIEKRIGESWLCDICSDLRFCACS
jgi:hypothetical protein